MYRSGEEDWTKHDTVAALVTHSKPALWKFSAGQNPCTALYVVITSGQYVCKLIPLLTFCYFSPFMLCIWEYQVQASLKFI